jgi:hypothetical protein
LIGKDLNTISEKKAFDIDDELLMTNPEKVENFIEDNEK